MKLVKALKEYIDRQYKKPSGAFGTYIGEKMVRQHKPETKWTLELLDIDKEEEILELGCGAGYAMSLLLQSPFVSKVTGLDISETVLKSAQFRNKSEFNKGRAILVQGDVSSLPFESERYTRIFSIQSLYFWEKIDETISEIHRVLRPGGRLIITLSNGKSGETWSGINDLVAKEVIPAMEQYSFSNIELLKGPDSRDYHTIAIVGEK
jgi:ubiquinone/menaquinone biosynthesis C-methylase UbiE